MRIRIIKSFDGGKVGDVLLLPQKEAKLLIKNGYAIYSKDMTATDMRTK